MLYATRIVLGKIGRNWNGQLFLTGYSEGGNATMALHHYLETKNIFEVTASAPMAGPYDLSDSAKTVINTPSKVDPRISAAELAYLVTAFQHIYGGVYSSIDEAFKPQFVESAKLAFDGTHSTSQMLQIFNGSPKDVFQANFLRGILEDPSNRLVALLGRNNTYGWSDWKPQAPIKLFQGRNDTEVPFYNSELANRWLQAVGATSDLVSLGDHVTHGTGLLLGFQKALTWFESLHQH
jgi:Secretory lipase